MIPRSGMLTVPLIIRSISRLFPHTEVRVFKKLPFLEENQVGERFSKQDIYKKVHGLWWDAPVSAGGAGSNHCEDPFYKLWWITANGRNVWGLEENKCTSIFKKDNVENPGNDSFTSNPGKVMELSASWAALGGPWPTVGLSCSFSSGQHLEYCIQFLDP